MNENYGLDRILKDYDILLFDTNVIFGPFDELSLYGQFDHNSMCDKRDSLRLNIDYTRYLQKGVQEGKPFFVTSLIHRELQRHGNNPFKKIKKSKRKQFSPSLSMYDTRSSERDRLAAYFSNYNKVVSLSETETESYKKVRGDLERGLDSNLSEADRDFLFTGIALALNRRKVALLSNDIPILDSYEGIIERNYGGLKENVFWFFKGCRGKDYFLPGYFRGRKDKEVHSSRVVIH